MKEAKLMQALARQFEEYRKVSVAVDLDSPELLERLAAIEHDDRWSGWESYRETKKDQIHPSGEPYEVRWKRLRETPYAELSERDKESDRIEVRKSLAVIRAALLGS